MSRRKVGELVHGLENLIIDAYRSLDRTAVYRFEADRLNVFDGFDGTQLNHLLKMQFDCGSMVRQITRSLSSLIADGNGPIALSLADTVGRTHRQQAFSRHIEELALEARRAEIGDQDNHNLNLDLKVLNQCVVWPSDHMGGDEFADPSGRFGAGIYGSLH